MGFLYVKVIETKKIAVRSSFFVNYPFVRIVIGKEKKSTNFKAGTEWWDKILSFRVQADENIILIAQARDKSIHVFGSDWLGETSIKMHDMMDGLVHQKWFKLGTGRKMHARSPRGYVHLAFQYFEQPVASGKRPFASQPVEPIQTFEEWLATNQSEQSWVADKHFSASTGSINPSPQRRVSSAKLRQSAPADDRVNSISPDEVRKHPARQPIAQKPKSKSFANIKNETRPRSRTVPSEILSPRRERLVKEEADASENSSSSYESSASDAHTGNLIDLSFDVPKEKSTGHHSKRNAETKGYDLFNRESPIKYSPKLSHSVSTSAATGPVDLLSKINHNPTFDDWYNPKDSHVSTYNPHNPFVALPINNAPAFSAHS